MAISLDLRQRIFEARQSGQKTSEVAKRFCVCPAFVRRLMQRYRETGSLAPKSGRRGPKARLTDYHDRLRELNAQKPDLTPAEIRDRLGLNVSVITVWRAFIALGLTFKKNDSRNRTKPFGCPGRPKTMAHNHQRTPC